MAVLISYYRNYDVEDTTQNSGTSAEIAEPSIFNWTAPEGYRFSHWNSARDGSGKSWMPGDEAFDDYAESPHYAIWVLQELTYLDLEGLSYYTGLIMDEINGKIDIGGKAGAIAYGNVDSTSTATAFTATVDGITDLWDGTTVMLHNGVVTSASGFTININDLGAKKCYNNMTNATRETTVFSANYTMLFVYSTELDEGNGGWWLYRGFNSNDNTIGYQLRTNSGNKVASDTGYRYRIWLTQADGKKWVPINTSSSINATSNRTLNTRPIDPFGPIVYRASNSTCSAGAGLGATVIWQQYVCNIGYSYMASGFSLVAEEPVYLRCTPQSDGSAVMQDITQDLPSSKDGKIYILLGTASNTTNMELSIEHPVYWHDGAGIRIWTGIEPLGIVTGEVSGTIATVSDAYAAPPMALSVEGSSTQVTTTGKNLLDPNLSHWVNKPIPDIGNRRSYFIPADEGVTYNWHRTGGNFYLGAAWCNDTDLTDFYRIGIWTATTNASVTNSSNYAYLLLFTTNSDSADFLSRSPIIEKGSTYTGYEPYTGGMPSPSPAYPQPILSVDGVELHASADGTTDATNWPVTLYDGMLRSLPDGTKDTLSLSYLRPSTRDGWAWYSRTLTKPIGMTTTAATDGITGTVGVDVMSTTGEIADGPTVLYKLASAQTTTLDPIELPQLPAPNATVWCDGGSVQPTMQMEYVRDTTISTVISAIGGLPTVSSSDNGKVLTVVNGAWTASELPVYDGTVI